MAVRAVPAVGLACLLNVLDGVSSNGMIIFPSTGIFADLGLMGVSMFFVTTVVAQLVYTLRGLGLGPFFHILALGIASEVGEDDPMGVIATAFSSILTGLAFFLLGALKLGVV
ncbi:hypothetical protein B0H34DRAFT_728619, partial [Crassisporium funariophilum]